MFSSKTDKGEIRESRKDANAGAGRDGMLPSLIEPNLKKQLNRR